MNHAPVFPASVPSTPLAAALAALADIPAVEPVPALTLSAAGRLVIVGSSDLALGWAERLAGQREVSVLVAGLLPSADALAETPDFALDAGSDFRLSGHLGAFALSWQTGGESRSAVFDLVLDLLPQPLLNRVELPTGYLAPGRDPLDQALAVIDLLAFDGEFEKPRYVAVSDKLCAHGRSKKSGCRNCIEVCATEAIASNGDTIKLDPYLCQGCGTCTTVCPSGALAYQYPRVADLGQSIKVQLAAFRAAGGQDPCLLFHSTTSGRKHLAALKRSGRTLPDNVIVIETWSVDAVGIDLLLGAVALGASRVAILGLGPHDLAPLQKQVALGQAVLNGMGFAGEFLRLIDPDRNDWIGELAAWSAPSALPVAEFRLLPAKRTTLEFVIDHLLRHAPAAPDSIALPAGSPFGNVTVSDACTLCMSCTSACPASALKAAPDAPRLSFIERNCLQCGLCVNTCPEQAITLTPRLLLKDRRAERLLKEAEIFCCTVCHKPMGAAPTILGMIAKLSSHSMFSTPEEKARLSMCGDCRVVDLIQSEKSTRAWEMTE